MNYIEIENEMTKTYNTIATKYEKEAQQDWKNKRYVDKFLGYLKNNASILDIGCGTGELLKYYSYNGFIATGIDSAKEMVSIAKRKVPNADVMEMSLYNIDKLQGKYDAISATFVLVHIPKDTINEVVNKISKKLNPNGIFFIVFTKSLKEGLQEEPLDSSCKYYVINYSKDEVCDILINNGFEIIESIEETRLNKSDVAIVIARKCKNR